MEVADFFETVVNIHHNIRHHISEDSNLHTLLRDWMHILTIGKTNNETKVLIIFIMTLCSVVGEISVSEGHIATIFRVKIRQVGKVAGCTEEGGQRKMCHGGYIRSES
jgi:hypothetical protein